MLVRRAYIHEVIERCAAEGMAILLVSTDSDELARLSDRVLVLVRGRVACSLDRSVELTPELIHVWQLGSDVPERPMEGL